VDVLVDTPVWSSAFRRSRQPDDSTVAELAHLIREGRALIVGPIRQEVLSGVRAPEQMTLLRDTMRSFPDLPLHTDDYEQAAVFFNRCRARGIQGSHIDFLICAVAHRHTLAILTSDRDFEGFARVIRVQLHRPR
jgi:predicted nucleic acid-binding protein